MSKKFGKFMDSEKPINKYYLFLFYFMTTLQRHFLVILSLATFSLNFIHVLSDATLVRDFILKNCLFLARSLFRTQASVFTCLQDSSTEMFHRYYQFSMSKGKQ